MKSLDKKICNWDELSKNIQIYQSKGKKIVFTNGCFDLIHTGHTRYLQEARLAGDFLVVALNSDQSVSQLKGPKRPIIPLIERMEIMAGFSFVDFVTSFEELDPARIIESLKPDILIKGGDWPVEKIIGRDFVESNGGQVYTIPEIPGRSTSEIINKIVRLYKS